MRLRDLLSFENIVIQCHDFPDADALASGFAVYRYLEANGKKPRLIYGGKLPLQKSNLILMVEKLAIPVSYVKELEKPELLITVDCQYGGGNVQAFEADTVAVIDHHQISGALPELSEVRSNLGACATILYDMLLKEGYDIKADTDLSTALYYGLLTDTNNFAELSHPLDKDLRDDIIYSKRLITLFRNSNLSFDELTIAGEALIGYEYQEKYRYAIAEAEPCDPNILGLISDTMLEVDGVDSCVIFSKFPFGVKISVRSCVAEVNAKELAEVIAKGKGNGGGHREKAGGFLQRELMKPAEYENFIDALKERLDDYFGNTQVIYAAEYEVVPEECQVYRKKNIPIGFVKSTDLLPEGTPISVRTLEGDVSISTSSDTYIMIGIKGEVYPTKAEKFRRNNKELSESYKLITEYNPIVKNLTTGEKIDLLPYARTCVPTGEVKILAKPLTKRVKVFTSWDPDKYMSGQLGDLLATRMDDLHDVYVIERKIFGMTYEEV